MSEQDGLLLTPEEIKELIKETGWGLKRAESLNLVSNYTAVAEAQLAKVKQHDEQKRLDRPDREKIARICNHTHTKDGYSVDWEDLKEYEKAVFLNDADQILALISGIEALDELRTRLTDLEKKLDDREEDSIEAKKQERVEAFDKLTNQGEKVYGFDWVVSKKVIEWQFEMMTDPEVKRLIWHILSGQALKEEKTCKAVKEGE